MEKPPPNLVLGSIKAFKSRDHPQKAKVVSFFTFVLSIFVYISIFYLFNLSSGKLFNNTKFWFFISNTLILIIALDYGSFSSSSKGINKHGVYKEYVIMRRQRSVPSFPSSYQEIIKTVRLDEEEVKKDGREKRRAAHQGKLSIVHESDEHENAPAVDPQVKKLETRALKLGEAYRRKKKVVVAKTLQRSKSESFKRVMFDESKNIIRRIETEKHEPPSLLKKKMGMQTCPMKK